jgi:hypothetical protein
MRYSKDNRANSKAMIFASIIVRTNESMVQAGAVPGCQSTTICALFQRFLATPPQAEVRDFEVHVVAWLVLLSRSKVAKWKGRYFRSKRQPDIACMDHVARQGPFPEILLERPDGGCHGQLRRRR